MKYEVGDVVYSFVNRESLRKGDKGTVTTTLDENCAPRVIVNFDDAGMCELAPHEIVKIGEEVYSLIDSKQGIRRADIGTVTKVEEKDHNGDSHIVVHFHRIDREDNLWWKELSRQEPNLIFGGGLQTGVQVYSLVDAECFKRGDEGTVRGTSFAKDNTIRVLVEWKLFRGGVINFVWWTIKPGRISRESPSPTFGGGLRTSQTVYCLKDIIASDTGDCMLHRGDEGTVEGTSVNEGKTRVVVEWQLSGCVMWLDMVPKHISRKRPFKIGDTVYNRRDIKVYDDAHDYDVEYPSVGVSIPFGSTGTVKKIYGDLRDARQTHIVRFGSKDWTEWYMYQEDISYVWKRSDQTVVWRYIHARMVRVYIIAVWKNAECLGPWNNSTSISVKVERQFDGKKMERAIYEAIETQVSEGKTRGHFATTFVSCFAVNTKKSGNKWDFGFNYEFTKGASTGRKPLRKLTQAEVAAIIEKGEARIEFSAIPKKSDTYDWS